MREFPELIYQWIDFAGAYICYKTCTGTHTIGIRDLQSVFGSP